MNYYERHLGDYARDTAHLSLLEHGVYTLLLDRYYATEQGIPVDQAHRLARARTDEERAAVDVVLAEFFHIEENPSGSVWVNSRVEEELAKARARINAARENGKKGGRPPKVREINPDQTPDKPSGFSVGSANETQPKAHQTPDTRHQKEQQHVQPPAARSRFDEFWALYPVKRGKAAAHKTWQKRKLDAMADTIIAHVQRMQREDDCWLRGYIPHGSTYINGSGWEDEPKKPQAGAAAPPPESFGAAAAMRRSTSETPLERDIAWANQQHRLGAIDAAERDRLVMDATARHRAVGHSIDRGHEAGCR